MADIINYSKRLEWNVYNTQNIRVHLHKYKVEFVIKVTQVNSTYYQIDDDELGLYYIDTNYFHMMREVADDLYFIMDEYVTCKDKNKLDKSAVEFGKYVVKHRAKQITVGKRPSRTRIAMLMCRLLCV